jgi:hypothetical protein
MNQTFLVVLLIRLKGLKDSVEGVTAAQRFRT